MNLCIQYVQLNHRDRTATNRWLKLKMTVKTGFVVCLVFIS